MTNEVLASTRAGSVLVSCAALLFDMDGVLIDSTPAVERVWSGWAREHGLDPTQVIAHVHGRPSISTIRYFLPDSDFEMENRDVERREIEDTEGIVLLPGAAELLRSLPKDRWTIATSCTRSLAEVRLRAAGLPVPERIVTSTDVSHGKPHPQPFLKAAAKLGFSASECIVVEDVAAGVRAGKSAGARVIGLRTTILDSELCEAGADFILDSCTDIALDDVSDSLRLRLRGANTIDCT